MHNKMQKYLFLQQKTSLFCSFFMISVNMHLRNELYGKHEFHFFFFVNYSLVAAKTKRLHNRPQKEVR